MAEIDPVVSRYKIAYTKGVSDMLYSKMFDDINDATSFGHTVKGPWLAFEKKASVGSDYSWKLLPYGSYKAYNQFYGLYKYRSAVIILFVIILGFIISRFFKR